MAKEPRVRLTLAVGEMKRHSRGAEELPRLGTRYLELATVRPKVPER